MNSKRITHLSEDHIIRAVVDHADLTRELQEHLSQCPQCGAKKRQAEENLAQLGRMAEQFSPTPQRPIRLPARQSRAFFLSRPWQFALGTAFACLFIWVLAGPLLFKDGPVRKAGVSTRDMIESDQQFMTDVAMLSENALPQEYMDMIGESDEDSDEDFMDFLIPSLEDDNVSLITINNFGGEPC